jgi:sugar O-acyltransferase (sialic acid O-acetyltransferase NeuD family)
MGRELARPGRAAVAAGRFDELVFVVDAPGEPVLGHRVLGPDELTPGDALVIALGSSAGREAVARRLERPWATLIDETAIVGPDVELGEGAAICAYSILTASLRIGRHFQCNHFGLVSHDCEIGDFVTFAPRVTCNGTVHIGDGAYIGAGAVLRNGSHEKPLRIGAGAVVGMGAVVTKDVPAGATVVGNPARPLQRS